MPDAVVRYIFFIIIIAEYLMKIPKKKISSEIR